MKIYFLLSLLSLTMLLQAQNPVPTHRVGVKVSTMTSGEQFVFSLDGSELLTVDKDDQDFYFNKPIPEGQYYTIRTVSGPRQCRLSGMGNYMRDRDTTHEFICEQGTTVTGIAGVLYAPNGTRAVVQLNGARDKAVAVTNNRPQVFGFPGSYPDGSRFRVNLKSVNNDCICILQNADVTTPASHASQPRILCDYKYEHVSKSGKTYASFYETSSPSIGGGASHEGKLIAFVAYTANFAGSSGRKRQVFVYDRLRGETTLVSKGINGEEGNNDSETPYVASNGSGIVFASSATNLVPGDNNGVKDIFYWRPGLPLQRINVGPNGEEANAPSTEPCVGWANIAYSSYASNLGGSVDGTSVSNIYLYNLQNKTTTLITKDHKTGKAVGGARPSLSNANDALAFCSYSAALVPDDRNGLWDIFVYQNNQPLKRVSMTHDGKERNQGDESASRIVTPTISDDGRFVAFATTASNMVPNDNNKAQDVFVVEVATGKVKRASIASDGTEGNGDSPIGQGARIGINANGEYVAFSTKASNLGANPSNIIMHHLPTGKTTPVTNIKGNYVGEPAMSIKGNYVVFGSGEKLDPKVPATGIYVGYTAVSGVRFLYQY